MLAAVAAGTTLVACGAMAALGRYLCYRPHAVSLSGAHVLITGGSSGIGLALALRCLHEGAAHVCIVGSTEARLAAALSELQRRSSPKQKVSGIAHDVAQPSLIQVLKAHTQKHGEVDILVTSAGVTHIAMFDQTPPEVFERLMRVNYLGTVHAVHAVLAGMKARRRGRIIFVSSMGGQTGVVGYGSYSPTKFALRGLAEVLSMELCPQGIGVVVCNPPNVDTPMYAAEMRDKPLASRLCEEGSGLFTAEQIADGIVCQGIRNYSFFLQWGFDGHALGIGSIGMAPASSILQLILEVLTLGPLRLVGLGYLRHFYAICRRCAASDAAAAAPSSKAD